MIFATALGNPCRVATWSYAPCAKPNLNSATSIFTAQKRWASQASKTEDDNKISIGGPRKDREENEDEEDTEVVYYGPMSSMLKTAKLVSLSACCCSVYVLPAVTFMTSPGRDEILTGLVLSSGVFFIMASLTAQFHWFVSPYIHKLRWQPGSDSFEVEMMSWSTTYIPRTIKFADIRPPGTNWRFAIFEANGNLYVVDLMCIDNEELLAKLIARLITPEIDP